MKCAVIDIGSNTIRMIVCLIDGEHVRIIGDARERSILLDCVYDRCLDKRGIYFLCRTLSGMKHMCDEYSCEKVYAFATSSLRNIDNGEYVCAYVKNRTGIEIDIISGEREAVYDYEGLRHVKQTYSGAALDLGGGSCQIFRYDGGKLRERVSLSLGSLRMYHAYVAGDIPTEEEAAALYEYVLERLSEYPEYHALEPEVIYAMGGTARCALQLYERLYRVPYTGRISVQEMERMYRELIRKGQKSASTVRRYFSDRVNSLVPGMITLCAICAYVHTGTIEEARCGVREGYLMREIIRSEPPV